MQHKDLIAKMTLAEKVALCSGADFWTTKAFAQYGIPSIYLTDGPHGVRKQVGVAGIAGVNQSLPSTCFPTACASACSWDRDLLAEMGAAIAGEARQEGVAVVLGPSANLKRNPLCGRNFEYFSEDPFLTGELAAAWINGVQSQGVGVSLKHFAANNQENERMLSDSIVDERALRELYLPAFEKAVKQAKPASVMCAYNRLNGVFCSDHTHLLREILRDEWGFEGAVITDWGAMNDRVAAFHAGLDLEMPGGAGYYDQAVIAAVKSEELSEARLDESVGRLLELIFSTAENQQPGYRYDPQAHHQLAKRIAAASAVLLKNEGGLLPLVKGQKIALLGALAEMPRYQGAGSSFINPKVLSSAMDGFNVMRWNFTYHPGYPPRGRGDNAMLQAAVESARTADVVVVFAGLTEEYESEGYDRTNMKLPDSHNALIEAAAKANPGAVVVLMGGAPVEMPWLDAVKAVLHLHLPGQAGGLAAAELLAGVVNPSGKLAESYPLVYDDVPSAGFFEQGGRQAQYREGIYVGYRYYDKAQKAVRFPFGFGLSYTTFEYADLALSAVEILPDDGLAVSLHVKNTGKAAGAEVVQLYVSHLAQPIFRPDKELKEFAKVFLQPGESQQVTFTLDRRAFAVYDPSARAWVVPDGEYAVQIGASSRQIRLTANILVHGTPAPTNPAAISAWYTHPSGQPTQADFESLLGRHIEPEQPVRRGEFTIASTLRDMQGSFFIRLIVKYIEKTIARKSGGLDYSNPNFKMMVESAVNIPVRNLVVMSSGVFKASAAQGVVDIANGRLLPGIKSFLGL